MAALSSDRSRGAGRTLGSRVHDGLDTRSRTSDKALAATALLGGWLFLVVLASALLH